MKKLLITLFAVAMTVTATFAQLRPGDKSGINVFETPKSHEEFEKLRVEIGGGFTAGYQAMKHENGVPATDEANQLMDLGYGFNNPSANMDIRGYLTDGVTLNLEVYLAARHHHDTWVKGGFIQIDKVPFMKSQLLDMVMQFTTLKVGQFDVNYGDAHFRRSDGGKTFYNAFAENYILDAFATEMGAEVDILLGSIVASASVTNGMLNPELSKLVVPEGSGSNGKRNPSFIAKLGYDHQFNDLRFRLTGSVYTTKGSGSNTLYSGDRTGSNYFGVLEPAGTTTSAESPATSGRYSPGYGDNVTAFMGNLFLKYKGLEWFSTLESSTGRALAANETRKTSQFATELILRFGSSENFYVGGRYNTVKSRPAGFDGDINIDRISVSGGWFPTKNLLVKLEYVNQQHKDYPNTNRLFEGKFNGLVVQAAVGF
ncbi:MAG: hypothetical protein LBE56_02690 [Tannerella sp.]|jgi:hypothetical protein|nr:hypothetical protein [Tannerella sp.]